MSENVLTAVFVLQLGTFYLLWQVAKLVQRLLDRLPDPADDADDADEV